MILKERFLQGKVIYCSRAWQRIQNADWHTYIRLHTFIYVRYLCSIYFAYVHLFYIYIYKSLCIDNHIIHDCYYLREFIYLLFYFCANSIAANIRRWYQCVVSAKIRKRDGGDVTACRRATRLTKTDAEWPAVSFGSPRATREARIFRTWAFTSRNLRDASATGDKSSALVTLTLAFLKERTVDRDS